MATTPAQLAITLSAISYLGQFDPNSKRHGVMNQALTATLDGGWQVAWGPATQGEDLVYVAADSAGQYAVVVRGTLFTRIEDLIQDKGIGSQVALPFTAPDFPDAAISAGALEVWKNIVAMESSVGPGSGALLPFLQALPQGTSLVVTGHSLGGQVATVLAAWFQSVLTNVTVQPLTFAAPTAGNPAFATAFTQVFPDAGRYFNALDVVPRAWTVDGLTSIKSLYPGGPQCGLLCRSAVDRALDTLEQNGLTYQQPGAGTQLTGQLYSVGLLGAFEAEVDDQHRALYYMDLLGIPLATIQQLDTKWAPPSSAAVRAAG
ncbi:lipase family protein [Myxococcus sp. K15C18031901]|uniref:lipase family protein n=1 Tax=Myxococcus dinghuensis TaxID=2906761 RepID=UPI0020A7D48D|nr:lipase family protein [Myxococcus dinghuensis]MCP3103994.1 lipase family protein [Myxococcus dinghuensis]